MLWTAMDEADVLIAHNGDGFDIKKIQARMLINKMTPMSPFESVDTLKAARASFKFSSNKLDDLGVMLGVGRKLPNAGMKLWTDCIEGKMKAWKEMKKYNKQDVVLLRDVYKKLRPWMANHPNLYKGDDIGCPKCESNKVQKRGTYRTKTGVAYQRYYCKSCDSFSRARTAETSNASNLPLKVVNRK